MKFTKLITAICTLGATFAGVSCQSQQEDYG